MTDPDIKNALVDRSALALTLWGEARNQGLDGLAAVGCVIVNRARDPRWPATARGVCLQPKQFSCWNDGGDHNHALVMAAAERIVMGLPDPDRQLAECLWLADGLLGGLVIDRTKAANHYMTAKLYEQGTVKWAKGKVPTEAIGDHVFFRF